MSVFGVRMTIRRGELVRLLPARSLKSRERERARASLPTPRKDNPDMESIKEKKPRRDRLGGKEKKLKSKTSHARPWYELSNTLFFSSKWGLGTVPHKKVSSVTHSPFLEVYRLLVSSSSSSSSSPSPYIVRRLELKLSLSGLSSYGPEPWFLFESFAVGDLWDAW